MERKIYKIVLEKGIITQTIFDELEKLYEQRNKVIHIFIITDIRTEDILDIANDYHRVGEKVGEIVNSLEEKQSELKTGIHKDNDHLGEKMDDTTFKELITKIRDKHGNIAGDNILGEKIK